MQIQSAPLVPEPICNHNELVPNEIDPDHLVSPSSQSVEVPEDSLLDHPPALAVVDGVPGFRSKTAGGNGIISSLCYPIFPVTVSDNFDFLYHL